MNRCLNERTLLRVYCEGATAADEAHLRWCGDCAERYDAVGHDLHLIGEVLTRTQPPVRVTRRRHWHVAWIPVAAVATLLIASIALVRRATVLEPSQGPVTVATFAAEMSAALFGTVGVNHPWQVATEAPPFGRTLDGGWSCAQYHLLPGDCADDDHVAALLAPTE
jgi:hypothetical protein